MSVSLLLNEKRSPSFFLFYFIFEITGVVYAALVVILYFFFLIKFAGRKFYGHSFTYTHHIILIGIKQSRYSHFKTTLKEIIIMPKKNCFRSIRKWKKFHKLMETQHIKFNFYWRYSGRRSKQEEIELDFSAYKTI